MADDLAEDWWVEEENEQPNVKDQDGSNISDVKKNKKKSLKRVKADEDEKEKDSPKKIKLAEVKKKKSKKNKETSGSENKRKRRRITDVPEEVLNKPGTAEDFHNMMTDSLKDRLGEAAVKDLLPDAENHFFQINSELLSPSAYLKSVLSPIWRSALKKSLYMKKTGSPCLLIITGSAMRAVEIIRGIKDFMDGKCKTAKLFAKHMKVEEQKKFLGKNNIQIGIGTPSRISLLIKQGALHIEDLVGVVLDWNRRDVKLKRMIDIPEIRKDLMNLLTENLLETVQGSACKFALM